MDRRVFLKGAAAGLALTGLDLKIARAAKAQFSPSPLTKPSQSEQDLADKIIAYAKTKSASYCDVRISHYLSQTVSANNNTVTGISDSNSFGIGIRVIKDGTWGFAATRNVTEESAMRACDEAIAIATANAKIQSSPVDLVPVAAVTGEWKTPIKTNPFDVSFKDRAQFLLQVHSLVLGENANGHKMFVRSDLNAVREEKYFASSEGSRIWQELTRIDPATRITASDTKSGQFASRSLFILPQGKGFEYVEEYPYKDEIAVAVSEAVRKVSARSVESGNYDLVLHPSHLWLTIHESIGHPTELDRILGYEANFAGTSFVDEKKVGKFTYANENVTVVADRTQAGALATVGYDDDGCPAEEYPLIENGELVDLQTTREQAKSMGHEKSHAQSYAQGWWSVPFQRMPNISLKPNPTKLSFDSLVKDTEKGILIKGNSSYSIDQQRYNFQFTGQVAYEIKNGVIGDMLRDVAYQATSRDFWKSCNAVCDESTYMLGGAMYDGKGEPMQANPVSHGCPTARFRKINVINTRSQSANARTNMIDYEE